MNNSILPYEMCQLRHNHLKMFEWKCKTSSRNKEARERISTRGIYIYLLLVRR